MQVILDTGPWVALIDRSESKHLECVAWLKGFDGEIFSTEAVLTEVLYLLNFSYSAQSAAFNFVLICLAQDLAIKNIVTFDKKHFSIYRLQGRQTFIILP